MRKKDTLIKTAPAGRPAMNISLSMAILSILISALVLVYCWYRWVFVRAYRQFPSRRMDTKWIPRIIAGRYSKSVSPTSIFFCEIVKETKQFQKDGLCVLWFLRPYLFVFGDELIKMLFNEEAVTFKSRLHETNREIFGNGLIGREGEAWKVHRKLLNPAFNLSVLKGKIPIFNENAVDLVENLRTVEKKPTENLMRFLKQCSFNAMTEAVLGFKRNNEKYAAKAENFMKMLARATRLSFARLTCPWLHGNSVLHFFPLGRQYMEAVDGVHAFTYEIVEELKKSAALSEKEELQSGDKTEVRKSIAQILIDQHMKNSSFTVEDMRDNLGNIIIAGYDSTAIGVMWCIYLLGHHPEVQERAHEEIMLIAPAGDVTYEHLGKLKYLDCVIKETLRLYPPLAFYGRRTNREIQCGKYKVPGNTDVIFSPFLLHRNPYVYHEPEKFDPERFSGTTEIRPWMHIPFAEGYRNCIGKRFALMESKVLLVHVLRSFRFESLNKIDDSELDWTMVLKPTKRMRMLFTNRSCQSCTEI